LQLSADFSFLVTVYHPEVGPKSDFFHFRFSLQFQETPPNHAAHVVLFQLDPNNLCSLPTFQRFNALSAFGFVLAHKPFRFVTGASFEINDSEDAIRGRRAAQVPSSTLRCKIRAAMAFSCLRPKVEQPAAIG